MDALPDISAANRALRLYLRHAEGKLPSDTFEQLEQLVDSPSAVDAIRRSADLLYARRDELDDEGKTVVAQLASFAATSTWHGMEVDNRGGRIALAMRRDLGEKPAKGQGAFPKAETDPEAASEYVRKPATPDKAA